MIKNIVWDFDKTLMPMQTERILMPLVFFDKLSRGHIWWCISRTPWIIIGLFLYLINSDYKFIKRCEARFYSGAQLKELITVAHDLGKRIPQENREKVREAYKKRYKNYVFSCGSTQPIKEMLRTAGILKYFKSVHANTLTVKNGVITGAKFEVPNSLGKKQMLKTLGIKASETLAVGDGEHELMLFETVAKPVVYGHHLRMVRIAMKNHWPIITSMRELKL